MLPPTPGEGRDEQRGDNLACNDFSGLTTKRPLLSKRFVTTVRGRHAARQQWELALMPREMNRGIWLNPLFDHRAARQRRNYRAHIVSVVSLNSYEKSLELSVNIEGCSYPSVTGR